MKKSTKIIIGVIAILAIAGFVGKAINGEPLIRQSETAATSAAPSKPSRTNAYIIAKQFAKEHLGSANIGAVDAGFEEHDGFYYVSGMADWNNRQMKWTVEMVYKSGDPYEKSSWEKKGWSTLPPISPAK